MDQQPLECSSEDGITTGLIEGLIATTRVLRIRNLTSSDVQDALKDLFENSDLEYLRSVIQ